MNFQELLALAMGTARKLDAAAGRLIGLEKRVADLAGSKRPLSVEDEINLIPGRRVAYNAVGSVTFVATDTGKAGDPVIIQLSQDGPFIQTGYPFAIWKPTAPTNADNLGRWSPVSTWPLPTQEFTNGDVIDISYDWNDGGSDRAFQTSSVPPVLSRPDVIHPLPQWMLWTPNSTIKITPTYERIVFRTAPTNDTTEGQLFFVCPGFKIANL